MFSLAIKTSLVIVQAGSDKNKSFCLQNKFPYNLKNSNKAKKLPAYSDQSVDQWENQRFWKTPICKEYIGENAIWVQFHAALQFSISFIQTVDTLFKNV